MKFSVPLFSLLCVFSACDFELPVDSPGQKTYIIKKGGHESNRTPRSFGAEVLSFHAKFDKSAIYQTRDVNNQADINKLLGFSDCNGHHQENSARFGWRWYNDRLEILAYCYVNGQRVNRYMRSIDIGKMYDFRIEKDGSNYIFTIDSESTTMSRNPDCSGNLNYLLFPYFGGDEAAPHNIRIVVNID